jgi:hypothetical protein
MLSVFRGKGDNSLLQIPAPPYIPPVTVGA